MFLAYLIHFASASAEQPKLFHPKGEVKVVGLSARCQNALCIIRLRDLRLLWLSCATTQPDSHTEMAQTATTPRNFLGPYDSMWASFDNDTAIVVICSSHPSLVQISRGIPVWKAKFSLRMVNWKDILCVMFARSAPSLRIYWSCHICEKVKERWRKFGFQWQSRRCGLDLRNDGWKSVVECASRAD